MPGLSTWAVRRPVLALITFFITVIAVIGISVGLGGKLNDSFSLPNTESTTAEALLSKIDSPALKAEANGGTAKIVWSPVQGKVTDPAAQAEIAGLLTKVASLTAVACVSNPFNPAQSYGHACPPAAGADAAAQIAKLPPAQQQAMNQALAAYAKASNPISADQTVAFANVTFAQAMDKVPTAQAKQVLTWVKAANTSTLKVGAEGEVLTNAGTEPPSSELVGVIAAIVILLIAFGSLVSAGLPLIVAILGLVMGQMGVLIIAKFMDVATFTPTLAAMIGLGVGTDYALFVLNRYRQAMLLGHSKQDSATEAVHTAGRAVLFAGSTVIIALLGLIILRINFFNGLALAAAVTVLCVMLSALWFLPALLSLMGTKAFAIRLPWGKKPGSGHAEGKRWAAYGNWLSRWRWITAIVSIAVVLILAIPTLSLRLGFADESGTPVGSPSRIAYDLASKGFGPGQAGPFIVAVQLPKPHDTQALAQVIGTLDKTPGVASTLPNLQMLPLIASNPTSFSPDGTITSVLVTPNSSPQSEETSKLLDTLRTTVKPQVLQATGTRIYVGGTQAVTSDFTSVLTGALPLFLLIVVALGFLALVLLFRSILIPLAAVVTSLLSFAAATGITVAVFQWGWLNSLLGVPGTGPIFPFLPILVFAILFGLSMDYQVFLVSRMREEWDHTYDNGAAVRRGLAGSGRVVVIAALIMTSVFAAFIPTNNSTIKLFGIGLATAVLIDAFIIRLVFIPSLMFIVGKANWWLPGWLDRLLPHVKVEPGEDEVADVELVTNS